MKRVSPLLTLLAGLTLGGFMLGLDEAAYEDQPPAAAAPSAPPSPAVSTPPPATTAPATTAPAAQLSGSYAGTADIKGNPVPLAVTVVGDKAIAYLCDGRALEAWLRGGVTGSELHLSGKGGADLTGTSAGGEEISGEIKVQGGTYRFSLKKAVKPSGLYRATSATRSAVVGWIVGADGRQTGLVTTADGQSTAAPPLDTTSLTTTLDGSQVTAVPADPNAP